MPKRHILIAMAAILGAGLLFLVFNADLPIVRNSWVYAKAALNIIEHSFNPLPVIADPNLSHGKPIAFSLLSVPFVSVLGVNAGVKIASFLGTAFFLCVAYFFFVRLNRHAGIDRRFIPLELVLLFFSPLLFYQFWSAYPDSLFAGEVLLAFVLIDIIVIEHKRDTRALILLLGILIYAAILTKLYGMILGIAVPVYGILHLRSFLRQSAYVRSKIALFVVVFSGLGLAVVLARLGRNPTLDFAVDFTSGGGSGYSGYVTGLTDPSGEELISSIIIFIFALVLSFHFSLLFLLRGRALKSGSRPGWLLPPTCFGGLFLLGLLPFPGTDYNMRFFIPVFAFVVVAIVKGMLSTKKGLRRGILLAYVGAASFLTLNYNLEPVYLHFLSFNEEVAEPLLDRHRRLDNLRIDQHLGFAKGIEEINGVVESGGVLYWASAYYGTATHGVIEELGVRDEIEMRYLRGPSEIPSSEKTVYLAALGGVSELEDRFSIDALGRGIFRLVPLKVELTRPARDAFDPGEPVPLVASASAFADARVLRVEFLIDGLPIGIDTAAPYESVWQQPKDGRHLATARAHDSKGNVALSAPMAIFVGIRALERRIARSADDAEELTDGSTYLTSSDLELIRDSQAGDKIVGLRFTDIRIPRGTEIRKAYLQFTADEVSTEQTDLTIQAELAGDAVAFTRDRFSISSRKRTAVSVKWSPEPWNTVGERSERQRTPDLSALVGEVIAQPEWQEGHALVLIISGSGVRVAESYDYAGALGNMPLLYIEIAEDASSIPISGAP